MSIALAFLSTRAIVSRMSTNQTPVDVVIEVFGGVCAVARAINRDPSAVSRWQRRRKIPNALQETILDAARARNMQLTAEDLIRGRSSAT